MYVYMCIYIYMYIYICCQSQAAAAMGVFRAVFIEETTVEILWHIRTAEPGQGQAGNFNQ